MTALRRLARCIPRFRRFEKGAAAVEFALLALPFFLLVYAIIEIALLFTAELVLDKATAETGRMVRVGQVQKGGM